MPFRCISYKSGSAPISRETPGRSHHKLKCSGRVSVLRILILKTSDIHGPFRSAEPFGDLLKAKKMISKEPLQARIRLQEAFADAKDEQK